MKQIVDILHQYYFPEYDYKVVELKKENSLLKLELEVKKIKERYSVMSLNDLKGIIRSEIDDTYNIGYNNNQNIHDNYYNIIIKIKDEYNQEVEKNIIYVLGENKMKDKQVNKKYADMVKNK